MIDEQAVDAVDAQPHEGSPGCGVRERERDRADLRGCGGDASSLSPTSRRTCCSGRTSGVNETVDRGARRGDRRVSGSGAGELGREREAAARRWSASARAVRRGHLDGDGVEPGAATWRSPAASSGSTTETLAAVAAAAGGEPLRPRRGCGLSKTTRPCRPSRSWPASVRSSPRSALGRRSGTDERSRRSGTAAAADARALGVARQHRQRRLARRAAVDERPRRPRRRPRCGTASGSVVQSFDISSTVSGCGRDPDALHLLVRGRCRASQRASWISARRRAADGRGGGSSPGRARGGRGRRSSRPYAVSR